jgi:hypothetical protein
VQERPFAIRHHDAGMPTHLCKQRTLRDRVSEGFGIDHDNSDQTTK